MKITFTYPTSIDPSQPLGSIMANAVTIDCRSCGFDKLPDFENCEHLKELRCSDNQIRHLKIVNCPNF